MKKVATLTIPQDPDEPRLTMRIYRAKGKFYIRIESDHPAIPPFMPMPIGPTNLEVAKSQSETLLHIMRGVFRQALGRSPDFPAHLKEMESEIPAYVRFLESNSFLGQN